MRVHTLLWIDVMPMPLCTLRAQISVYARQFILQKKYPLLNLIRVLHGEKVLCNTPDVYYGTEFNWALKSNFPKLKYTVSKLLISTILDKLLRRNLKY